MRKKIKPSGSVSHLKPALFSLLTFCLFLFTSCTGKSSEDAKGKGSVKYEQYYLQGKVLYENNCSNCHQKNGTGLGLVYPPLNRSDFMDKNFEEVLCLMRNGKKGELIINGKSYVQAMPGVPKLTDLEIAEIATYIYNTWEHNRGMVDVREVSGIMSSCKN